MMQLIEKQKERNNLKGLKQFNEVKPINKVQARCLFKDLLNQDVKRFGTYAIGKYRVRVSILKHRRTREKTEQYYTAEE